MFCNSYKFHDKRLSSLRLATFETMAQNEAALQPERATISAKWRSCNSQDNGALPRLRLTFMLRPYSKRQPKVISRKFLGKRNCGEVDIFAIYRTS
jgi:hypothetical protein